MAQPAVAMKYAKTRLAIAVIIIAAATAAISTAFVVYGTDYPRGLRCSTIPAARCDKEPGGFAVERWKAKDYD